MEKAFLFNKETSPSLERKTKEMTFLCKDGSSIVIFLKENPIRKRAIGRDESQAAQFYEDISSVDLSPSSELTIVFSDGSKFSLDMIFTRRL